MKFNKFLLFMIMAAFAVVLAACGTDADKKDGDTAKTSSSGENASASGRCKR